MRTILQRVTKASVSVDDEVVGRIDRGVLLLVGVEDGDTVTEAEVTARKIAKMRVFPGRTPMDESLVDIGGACLVISQFTLAGSIRKGNRPSFTSAADPADAERLYLHVAETLRGLDLEVATGRFGAAMAVELVNDGPVTFHVDVRDGHVV